MPNTDKELTGLQRAMIEHDEDAARLDRNTLSKASTVTNPHPDLPMLDDEAIADLDAVMASVTLKPCTKPRMSIMSALSVQPCGGCERSAIVLNSHMLISEARTVNLWEANKKIVASNAELREQLAAVIQERAIAVRYLSKHDFERCIEPDHGCDGWHPKL